nr:hypothetical protein [Angustibacter aerolatus]
MAEEAQFAAALREVDRRLQAEIRERRRHRERIAEPRRRRRPGAAGRGGRLPAPDARAWASPTGSWRSSATTWILIAAQVPDQVPALMAIKHAQARARAAAPAVPRPRGPGRLRPGRPAAALARRPGGRVHRGRRRPERPRRRRARGQPRAWSRCSTPPSSSSSPAPRSLLALLEERGWVGWTDVHRSER